MPFLELPDAHHPLVKSQEEIPFLGGRRGCCRRPVRGNFQYRDHVARRHGVIRLGPHFPQHAGDDRFHLHDGLVGLDLQQRLAAPHLLARLDQPSQDGDFRIGGRQVRHFHLEPHVRLVLCRG